MFFLVFKEGIQLKRLQPGLLRFCDVVNTLRVAGFSQSVSSQGEGGRVTAARRKGILGTEEPKAKSETSEGSGKTDSGCGQVPF